MKNVSDKSCRDNQHTHIMFNNIFLRKSYRLRGYVGNYGTARHITDDNTLRRMNNACLIPKATNTHSECVMRIDFPLIQWLRGRASLIHL
jgi:hypothetical protein